MENSETNMCSCGATCDHHTSGGECNCAADCQCAECMDKREAKAA